MSAPNIELLQAQMKVWLDEAANYILHLNECCKADSSLTKPSDNLIQGATLIKAFSE